MYTHWLYPCVLQGQVLSQVLCVLRQGYTIQGTYPTWEILDIVLNSLFMSEFLFRFIKVKLDPL